MSKSDARKSLTPQELELRIIRARRRFKAIVRLVIANKPWLEDIEDEQLTENVKRNVQLLIKKRAKKGLLTLQQKSILCKPAAARTEAERLLLYRIIGGLKCFRKYPENVKMQLAAVSYFLYYGSNRTIVRQNHEAHALYFLLGGEVIVSISTWDPVIKETVTTNVGTMVAGSMFGEVSLMHDIPRTATITTATPCELLCVKKADFDIVLKASVKQQWLEIQKAMSKFEYFDNLSETAVREYCIYSKIKPYFRDQSIIGDGQGVSSAAYFILKGKCRIIEHLLVSKTYNKNGRKIYTLYEPEVIQKDESTIILDEKKQSCVSLTSQPKKSIFPSSIIQTATSYTSKKCTRTCAIKRKTTTEPCEGDGDSVSAYSQTSSRRMRLSLRPSKTNSIEDERRSRLSKSEPVDAVPAMNDEPFPTSLTNLPDNVETHFMQVCILSERACFGLGENMRRRRIVAMSDTVECLLIPRYWLFQNDNTNLWTRIQQYLDTNIPSTQTVFKEFLNQRKWLRNRKKLVQDIIKKPPVTAFYDIPYSIRINEDLRLDT
ncbi:Cyclic nucleotide-binding domain [Popillia japonica]|uniref:Cyclic nucleotide-binding domain n=1 Tax=Popillia japonica TaxID=7064 RepID=A0AAW1IXG1_POPJA